jgi:hypothetical protein
VGLTTLPQALTLTNNGGLTLNIASIAASPGFTIATNTCSATLAPAAICTLSVVFTPTAAGPATGTLTLTDNATPATQAVTLTGTGIDFTLASNGPTTLTLPSTGGSGSYPMLLSSLAGLSGNVAINCSGVPANTTCNVLPSVAPLGGTSTIAVTVETAVSPTSAAVKHTPGGSGTAVLLALLLPISLIFRRRRSPYFAAIFLLLAVTGCGANRVIPNSQIISNPTNPTPKGTYTLTVSGSSAGLTHSVAVTLVVQ